MTLTLELQLLSEACPALQPRTGAPHPHLWHSATEGALTIWSETGLAALRYCCLSGGRIVSIKSFSAEEILDLHRLSHPSTVVVLYRGAGEGQFCPLGTFTVSGDIFGYHGCGGGGG